MEEQRIGVMYLNLLKGRLTALPHRLFPSGLRRSPSLPFLVIGVIVLLPGLGWFLHLRGQFHKVKSEIRGDTPAQISAPRPGGVDPIRLSRAPDASGMPQFLSATVLPGLGMSLLQITAALPGRGETALLQAPTLASLADGTAGAKTGADDTRGVPEIPWGGSLTGLISPMGTSVVAQWRGRSIEVPTDLGGGRGIAEGGMLASLPADTSETHAETDGASATGSFAATDFEESWPSKTDVAVRYELAGRTLDLTLTAKNSGSEPEPLGLGWHLRLAIPAGSRDAMELRLPSGAQLEMAEPRRDTPSGRLVTADATAARFEGRSAPFGHDGLDATLIRLKGDAAGGPPAVELRDSAGGFGLRLIALSPETRALRVTSPSGASYITLGLQTSLDDPFGKAWTAEPEGGIAVLEPGQSVTWKVRLEIFPVARSTSSR